MNTMWEDPIVAEVHRAREKLAAEHNYDVGAFFAEVRKRQTLQGSRLVRQKRPAESAAEAEPGHDSNSGGAASTEAAPAA